MIEAQIIPHRIQKKETAMSQAMGSWLRMAALAGVLAFSSGAAARPTMP
jgi:hypothetical protein